MLHAINVFVTPEITEYVSGACITDVDEWCGPAGPDVIHVLFQVEIIETLSKRKVQTLKLPASPGIHCGAPGREDLHGAGLCW